MRVLTAKIRCSRRSGWILAATVQLLLALVTPARADDQAADDKDAAGNRHLTSLGVRYETRLLREPRPNRVHILRVGLSRGKVKPVVVIGADPDGDGPAETSLTSPLTLAKHPGVLAFVNSNPWDSFPDENGNRNRRWFAGQHVDISGLAATGGDLRSPPQANDTSVWITRSGKVKLGKVTDAEDKEAAVLEGMAGFQLIVKEGKVVPGPGGALHPRTSIGVDREGSVMWLVVVDGRQRRFSEGMNVHELGMLMRDLGCWRATNMDGGGSSIMGMRGPDGKLRSVNSPSDKFLGVTRIRPLPMVLTIRKREDAK
ncbi:MAG: phosphodiester glycosidase family protein [Pirellulaceae bacterium]|nr:phosphodiester glycosidase family protein [Pirellulaceae bacterium]